MSIFDTIKEVISNMTGHTQDIQDTVQGLTDGDIAQQLKDGAGDIGTNAQEAASGLNEKVQDVANNIKDGLGK